MADDDMRKNRKFRVFSTRAERDTFRDELSKDGKGRNFHREYDPNTREWLLFWDPIVRVADNQQTLEEK